MVRRFLGIFFFLPPSPERGGPAPSHRPDVSGHRSEDLPEARSRRVQREKPALGSLGGPPTSSCGSARHCLEERPLPPPLVSRGVQLRRVRREGGVGGERVLWEGGHPVGIERRLESWRGPVLNQSGQAWLVAGGGGCTTARVLQRRLRAHSSKTGAPPLFC